MPSVDPFPDLLQSVAFSADPIPIKLSAPSFSQVFAGQGFLRLEGGAVIEGRVRSGLRPVRQASQKHGLGEMIEVTLENILGPVSWGGGEFQVVQLVGMTPEVVLPRL